LQVEVSLLPEPPGIALVIAHVQEATVETRDMQQTRLLLTEEQATKLSEDLARRAWDLRQQSGTPIVPITPACLLPLSVLPPRAAFLQRGDVQPSVPRFRPTGA
jgi:hypothetical protein